MSKDIIMTKRNYRTTQFDLAFSLIEVLVVLAIIGILLGVAIPAVMTAREAGRRAECAHRLRQIGIALHHFHTDHGVFPYGMRPDGRFRDGRPFATGPISVLLQALPYLEEGSVFNAANLPAFQGPLLDIRSVYNTSEAPQNKTVATTNISAFVCPSDWRWSLPTVNYRATVGPDPFELEGTPWPGGGGAFPGLTATSVRDFTDGLSSTAGYSERTHGSNAQFDKKRDIWFTGITNVKMAITNDELDRLCALSTPIVSTAWTRSGSSWVAGRYADTLYNHVSTPNHGPADCSVDEVLSDPALTSGGSFSARSAHPGGVNLLKMDGTVSFVKQSVSLATWRSLATRSGGEAIESQ